MEKGIYTALITPLKNNGQIDYIALKNLLQYQANSLVAGIVVLGSTAEEKLLSKKEKINIINYAKKYAQNKQIIIGINEISIKNAKNAILAYNKFNPSAYLISPPCYLKLNQTEIENFYSSIAKVSTAPIIIYNIPSRTGSTIQPKTIIKLSKNKKIVALKDALCDQKSAEQIKLHAKPTFLCFCGNDNVFTSNTKIYSDGAICVASNLLPNLICSYHANRLPAKLKHQIINFTNALCKMPNPAGIKFIMSHFGLSNNVLREPLLPITHKNRQTEHIMQNIMSFVLKK